MDCENPSPHARLIIGPRVSLPEAWAFLADWGNLLAGLVLMAAFLLGALINSVHLDSVAPGGIPTERALAWLQFLFSTEGVLYALAEFFMIGVMAQKQPEHGGGSTSSMQFAILMAGGIFFALSGLVFPSCITNITYIFRKEKCASALAEGPYAWNAMAHYGITCFMVGTAIGFRGALQAPKDKFVSLFWGCAMYFSGAWIIGIFKFWGPVLAGGLDKNQNQAGLDMTAPAVAWTSTWWFGLLGAFCLTVGAWIFGRMNGRFGLCRP
eukprot:TRINITY_DN28658_c0_g1_i1.p1 TRINITY_DN28658_c0_g1~~TRINITY_DN28658_c0_g1_i1.p1  ORF type:complete len:267 (+),score=32.10 TRINITY_DN28658_c0_g1_i1:133-933(+)